mmetsp:Transcript_5272/g.7447  ORF Transcript_5272/g.7447 Transcript_5272/m.7447 type:complete len:151 (+) Transcript_5272:950-1402(+)
MVGSCSPFQVSLEKKYFKKYIAASEMLKYKYILSLEGNDVATGLKWQLASSSVVFMPEPSTETFAMEGLLVPFVHYIPVKMDVSYLDAMIQWAKNNDAKAKWISEQASKFMDDLWVSEKAQEDNILIRNKLAILYHKQFGNQLKECNKKK